MTVKNKSLLGLGAVAIAASMVLAGCASGAGSTDGTTKSSGSLTVWVDSERVDALKAAAAEYSE
jgi:arabinogalactan oligomer/maltooligosaccharide transport system substrate-binding protein